MSRIVEVTEAPDGSSTPYSLEIGDRFYGELLRIDESDWVSIELTAGVDYAFGMQATHTNKGSLRDPYVYLRDSDGTEVARNDDGGIEFDSLLLFTPTETGTYYLSAESYLGQSIGTYMLRTWGEAAVITGPNSGTRVATHRDSVLIGQSGDDHLSVDGGRGHFWGQGGNDTMLGGDGRDVMFGSWGNDRLEGGGGMDRLTGGQQGDKLIGGQGADTLKGHSGDDDLNGGRGDDWIEGGRGADRIIGGRGDDTLLGGEDSDTFIFGDMSGADTVTDFQHGGTDLIDLSANSGIDSYNDLMNSHMSQSGADVLIDDTSGNTVTLAGISLGDLSQDDFLF